MPPRRRSQANQPANRRTRREREQSPPPPPLPFELSSPNHIQRYRVLAKRPIIPSKFFDPFTITSLGLMGDVTTFLTNMGWLDFFTLHASTYTEITLEILSSLKSTFHAYDSTSTPNISFRCLGVDKLISLDDFNLIFGFPTVGLTWIEPDFQPDRAWEQLTGQPLYASSRSKASSIRNPALRYIHRVLAMSLFGRGESTGAVTKTELLFLWAMYNNIKVNTGAWLLRQLLHVAKGSNGKICCGGLLTLIAMSYGFIPLGEYFHVVEGSHLVDVDTLIHMKMCRHIGGGQFVLLDDGGHAMPREMEEEEAQLPSEDDMWQDFPQQPPPPPFTGQHDHEAGPSSSSSDVSMMQLMQRMNQMEINMGERMDRLGDYMHSFDARLTRSEEIQLQMLNLLQNQNRSGGNQ